jgi:hypothetical protein
LLDLSFVAAIHCPGRERSSSVIPDGAAMKRDKEQRPQDQEQLASVAARADTAIAAVKAEFAAAYDPTGLPEFALVSAETALRNAAACLDEKLVPLVSEMQELAALSVQFRTLTALAREAANVLDAFQAVITGLIDTVLRAPGVVIGALLDVYDVDLGLPAPETTPTRRRERANQLALTGALRRVLAVEAARLVPHIDYASFEEAAAARDRVATRLDEQAEQAAGHDATYQALVALRIEVQRAIPGNRVWPRLVTITQSEPVPLTALVYKLYGPLDPASFERLCDDIVARNKIRHPGFVSGELKVLAPTGSDRRP